MAYAVYEQATGDFRILEVEDGGVDRVLYETRGYAGRGYDRNRPDADHLRGRGPLPRGEYGVYLKPHRRFWAPAFILLPKPGTNMKGRAGFWIHGDSLVNPGDASSGCIILSAAAREWVKHYRVRHLEVLSGLPAKPGT